MTFILPTLWFRCHTLTHLTIVPKRVTLTKHFCQSHICLVKWLNIWINYRNSFWELIDITKRCNSAAGGVWCMLSAPPTGVWKPMKVRTVWFYNLSRIFYFRSFWHVFLSLCYNFLREKCCSIFLHCYLLLFFFSWI